MNYIELKSKIIFADAFIMDRMRIMQKHINVKYGIRHVYKWQKGCNTKSNNYNGPI